MNPRTGLVMDRYRELKKEGLSALEASVQVHQEAGKTGQVHWHRIHERCWCGYLTVPASFYTYDDKGRQTNTQEEAEAAYLLSLQKNVPTLDVPTKDTGFCDSCGEHPREGRYKLCSACRKRAYRERSR